MGFKFIAASLLAASCVLTACGGGDSAPPVVAPTITSHPLPVTVADGHPASFSVSASGSAPFTYQWQRDGVGILGADAPQYVSPPLSLIDSGSQFRVLVSNSAGTISSQTATVSVTPVPPVIVTQPLAVTTSDGGSVTLNVKVVGSAPFAYQWYRGEVAIPGAIGAELSFAVSMADSGQAFRVSVRNQVGEVGSDTVRIVVNPRAPRLTASLHDLAVQAGSPAHFAITADGTAPLRFDWQRSTDNGTSWKSLNATSAAQLTIAVTTLADANTRYRVVVSNAAASVTSEAAQLAVKPFVRVLAGGLGGSGFADGMGRSVRFDMPYGTASDRQGNIYVADLNNHVVRKITPAGVVSTYAGQPGKRGIIDGERQVAVMEAPLAVAFDDAAGDLFVSGEGVIRKVTATGLVSTFVGKAFDRFQHKDGKSSEARVRNISGMVLDHQGNLWVTDNGTTIRRISRNAEVVTIAGSPDEQGRVDGTGPMARFTELRSITVDKHGNLFACDQMAVRRITPSGEVTTFAGVVGQSGNEDGSRGSARFYQCNGLSFDKDDNLYVADAFTIRRITQSGTVSTLVGDPGKWLATDGFGYAAVLSPKSLTAKPGGDFVFADVGANTVRMFAPPSLVTTPIGMVPEVGGTDELGSKARFHSPSQVAVDSNGVIYVADTSNHRIRKVLPSGLTTTLAGGISGYSDGVGAAAQFAAPSGVVVGPDGAIYIADTGNNAIRKISPSGVVTTLAGSPGSGEHRDGRGSSARFSNPRGLALDAGGNLLVADSFNKMVRRVTLSGDVTTIFCEPSGPELGMEGIDRDGRFRGLVDAVVMDSRGNIYVTQNLHQISMIDPRGKVSSYAGKAFSPGFLDEWGYIARLNEPTGLAIDKHDNLYVVDQGNHLIRKISPEGYVSTVIGKAGSASLAPGADGTINRPRGVAVTQAGRLVVTTEHALIVD